MKIWMLTFHFPQEKYFFPTRREAAIFARTRTLELLDHFKSLNPGILADMGGPITTSHITFAIDPLEFTPTRSGIARLVDDVIEMTKFNEG